MDHSSCLNCGREVHDKYCSNCGQKTDTHRITFKNFISHDVLHGTFHIEKGILFTAKQALIRPGKAALDYISGKRKPYYNVFLLILLTIGLMLFLRHFYNEILIGQGRGAVVNFDEMDEASKQFELMFSKQNKIIIFLFVPLAAFNSYLIFRKRKLNLSEHAIIAGMLLLGILLISTISNALLYLDLVFVFSNKLLTICSATVIVLILLYIVFGYYNTFGAVYSKLAFAFKMLLFYALFLLQLIVLLVITVGYVTNWNSGEITISPF